MFAFSVIMTLIAETTVVLSRYPTELSLRRKLPEITCGYENLESVHISKSRSSELQYLVQLIRGKKKSPKRVIWKEKKSKKGHFGFGGLIRCR